MNGLHLTADLRGVHAALPAMTDPAVLGALCREAVAASGLQGVAELMHRFGPADGQSGITGVVLLAESHLAVHTWPELGAVTLDVYVCNYGGDNSARARALLDALIRVFAPAEVSRQQLLRG
ncbi:adenosylmethionine decarboxylase [Roseateles saccharophilus]|uniref:S-adenosylmethionine decarboxylase n=1 Tax=Roseateles saccharophilus TaxID=304 RepID=A0A4R3UNE7_ROSSA|nr:adenosylmethionine decarboxylase [Roseateles saccharophilus]MDG0833555.1 adenosylmethionine decarboxylase [Roseateles saccharophilus]TCU92197.1 S-adenosylmethionine decarboxylase [Roseateles saccharophilus]